MPLLPGLPDTPPPVRTWRNSFFFCCLPCKRTGDSHVFHSWKRHRKPLLLPRKRSSWVHLKLRLLSHPCADAQNTFLSLGTQNMSLICSLSISRSCSNLTHFARASLDDYLSYAEVWPCSQHMTDTSEDKKHFHPERIASAAGLLLLAGVQEEKKKKRAREDEEPGVSDISVSTFPISVFLSGRAGDHILVQCDGAHTRLPPPALWA